MRTAGINCFKQADDKRKFDQAVGLPSKNVNKILNKFYKNLEDHAILKTKNPNVTLVRLEGEKNIVDKFIDELKKEKKQFDMDREHRSARLQMASELFKSDPRKFIDEMKSYGMRDKIKYDNDSIKWVQELELGDDEYNPDYILTFERGKWTLLGYDENIFKDESIDDLLSNVWTVVEGDIAANTKQAEDEQDRIEREKLRRTPGRPDPDVAWEEDKERRHSARRQIWVGVMGLKRKKFYYDGTPTQESHGKWYRAVIGPFKTDKGADLMVSSGGNNPHIQSVDDAERLAKQATTVLAHSTEVDLGVNILEHCGKKVLDTIRKYLSEEYNRMSDSELRKELELSWNAKAFISYDEIYFKHDFDKYFISDYIKKPLTKKEFDEIMDVLEKDEYSNDLMKETAINQDSDRYSNKTAHPAIKEVSDFKVRVDGKFVVVDFTFDQRENMVMDVENIRDNSGKELDLDDNEIDDLIEDVEKVYIGKRSNKVALTPYMKSSNELPDDIKRKFQSLANQLSPENLAADGERPMSEVRKLHSRLMKEWKVLEKQVGRKVSESEVY